VEFATLQRVCDQVPKLFTDTELPLCGRVG
jgi:hypothetical protein